jgi:hypothetical protein
MRLEREKILLIGVGDLGGFVLEMLCRIPGICEIITADCDDDRGLRKTNSALEGASYMGLYPSIRFHHCDLLNIERTAELLAKVTPTIIFNGTTLLSPLLLSKLPPEVMAKLYKDKRILGPWAAIYVALTYKLMKAISMSGINTSVVNSSFPDVTNPSLARVDLAPTIGIGNIDLIVPHIQKAASELLRAPMKDVKVELIAHHYNYRMWCLHGEGYEVPHYLKVYLDNEDVTQRLGDMKGFIAELPKRSMRPTGYHSYFLSAASAVKNIMAILHDTNELTHAPGPQGLEGGYPVRLGRKGVEVILPKGMSLEQAREINLAAQRYEGIQEIGENGDIIVTEDAYAPFKETLKIDYRVITLEESFDQAMELRARFHELAKKHGADI